jgi:hypothetical protein
LRRKEHRPDTRTAINGVQIRLLDEFEDFAGRNLYVPQTDFCYTGCTIRHPLCDAQKWLKTLFSRTVDTRTVTRFTSELLKNHFLSMRPKTFHFFSGFVAEDRAEI